MDFFFVVSHFTTTSTSDASEQGPASDVPGGIVSGDNLNAKTDCVIA
jgi:hypothetical protein